MKKIIHLSDLHIGFEDLSSRFDEITNNIIFAKQPASEYIIVITGDIVDDATSPTYYEQAQGHIEKLRAAAIPGELREIERVVCPGGIAIHFSGMPVEENGPIHPVITSDKWGYKCKQYRNQGAWHSKYVRHF